MVDLGIEGGTVITSRGQLRANVYVSDGKISAVTGDLMPANERVDAGGLFVMPGMIDAHVHFMDPSATEREDFITGSRAAAGAGVTTVIEHTHSGPVRTAADLQEKAAYLRGRSHVDFALGAHAWVEMADQVGPVWRAGAAFIKAFTCTTHGVPGHNPAQLLTLMQACAEAGATCLVHCEEESLTANAAIALHHAHREDGGIVPAWRNREAELVAVATAAELAHSSGARVVVAHASNQEVLSLARPSCLIESCPQYLMLLEAEVLDKGSLRKFTPPARARSEADLEAMWAALADGSIDYMSSDHAPATIEQKRAGSIWDVHFGLPGIDTTFAVLLDGAHRGLITYERAVEVYSEKPAAIYGLSPRKGSLKPGADADIVIVDPSARWTVQDSDVRSKAGWSPFSGRTFVGRAVRTFLRGKQPEAGSGMFLAGPGSR